MEIKEALSQIKQVSSVLEAFKTIDEFLSLVLTCQESSEEMTQRVMDLEGEIEKKNSELSALEGKYSTLSTKLSENYERQLNSSKEGMKALKEITNKEYDEVRAASGVKIKELNDKVKDLQGQTGILEREIRDRRELLEGLNKSIESIKARLK